MSAILLAAGSGTRMNINGNKVYLPLGARGVPALCYPLTALEQNGYVDEIVLMARPEDLRFLREEVLRGRPPEKPIRAVAGGAERSDSVWNALEEAAGQIVLIHDGARPLLKQRYIAGCVEAMDDSPGAIVAVLCADGIRTVDENGRIGSEVKQGQPYLAQTPQCFHADILRECHRRVADKSAATDDSALLEWCGYPVRVLPGDVSNAKLTVPLDVRMAQHFLARDAELSVLL